MQPPMYERNKDFTEDFGTETDHSSLNAELDAASNSINDIRANLALIQADDGKIRAQAITKDSLAPDVQADIINEIRPAIADLAAMAQEGAAIATTKAGEVSDAATAAVAAAAIADAKAGEAGGSAAVAVAAANAAGDAVNAVRNDLAGASGASLVGFHGLGVQIPGGPAAAEKGFWADQGSGANIWRMRDRLLIGDAVEQNGNKTPAVRSWVGESASGYMTYLDSRSQMGAFSTIGAVAAAFASRSSDNVEVGDLNTIGVASYAKNDKANGADKKSAWAYYGHAVQETANEFTACMEVDIANRTALVKVNSFSMGEPGVTAAHWIGVGGETAQSGQSVNPASVAIGVISSATRNATAGTGALFEKGIVFQADAISGCDGINGSAIAVQMAKGHTLEWKYSGADDAVGGRIRSDVNDSSKQTRLIFNNGGFSIKGTKADLQTEINLFQVQPNQNAVNYIAAAASTTGAAVSFNAIGTDANIDFAIVPKGTGVLKLSYGAGTAANPANFQAQNYITIRDGNGTLLYIPCRAGTW